MSNACVDRPMCDTVKQYKKSLTKVGYQTTE